MAKKNIKPAKDIILSAYLIPKPFREILDYDEDINSKEVQKTIEESCKSKRLWKHENLELGITFIR